MLWSIKNLESCHCSSPSKAPCSFLMDLFFLLLAKLRALLAPRLDTATPKYSKLLIMFMSSADSLASFIHCIRLLLSNFSGWVAT